MKRKSYYLYAALIVLATIAFITLTTRSGMISLFSPADLTPTAIPPALLTQAAQNRASISATQTAYPPFATQFVQTEQALQLTLAAAPTLDKQVQYPIFNNVPPSTDEVLSGKPEGALAGYGILYNGQEVSDSSSKYKFNGSIWQESTYNSAWL